LLPGLSRAAPVNGRRSVNVFARTWDGIRQAGPFSSALSQLDNETTIFYLHDPSATNG